MSFLAEELGRHGAEQRLPLIVGRLHAAADGLLSGSRLMSGRANRRLPGRIGHPPKDGLLSLVDRLAWNRPGARNIPVLVQDVRIDSTLRIQGTVRIERAFVIEARTVSVTVAMAAAASCAARRVHAIAVHFISDVARTAAILVAQAAHRAAIGRWAIAVAVHRREQPLEGPEIAAALWAGKAAVARIARVAAIGRIADPFADVNVAAALAADAIPPEPRQNAAFLRAVAARFARPGPAIVAAAIPDDRPRPREAAGVASRAAARIAAGLRAATAGGGRETGQGQRKEQTSRHDGLPKRCQTSAVSICRVSYRPAKSVESTKSR